MKSSKKIVIVGAGAAGLFCAYELLARGHRVDIYDQQSGIGKKFLVAGNGGLNLTHSEPLESFCEKYGENEELFSNYLSDFSPGDLREWCAKIGVQTFVGTSGRVFPKSFKAAEILRQWQLELRKYPDFNLHLKHKLIAVDFDLKQVSFEHGGEQFSRGADAIVLALGGASWKKTGSDGKWTKLFADTNVELAPFKPMNCGFECDWSDFFKAKIERKEIKNIVITHLERKVRGEVMITPFGIEGGAIYALSSQIRNSIEAKGQAKIWIDLKPDLSQAEVCQRVDEGLKNKKKSLSAQLKSKLKLSPIAFTLIKEILGVSDMENAEVIAQTIKNLPITFHSSRPIDEAISTAGGICFNQLSQELELKAYPDIYAIGEMLDFEAPTGGYLLQGCFATAFQVAQKIDRPS